MSANEIQAVIVQNRPDYASLFGSLELCDCQHCRSIHSPAAYFVDLLQFIGPNIKAVTPLDVLIGNPDKKWPDGKEIVARRPDLAHLQLSCENTNTNIPYVDLVNEVLETYLAFKQTLPLKTDVLGKPLLPAVPIPNESSSGVTAAELAANPENTSDKAYDVLEAAVYPFTLPFNQPVSALRLTLEKMGTSRHEVMNVFRRTGGAEAEEDAKQYAVDAEVLKLTEREFAILTGKRFDGTTPTWPEPDWDVSNFYGFNSKTAVVETEWVKGNLPLGAVQHVDNDSWAFAVAVPAPESGALAHTSRVAPGLHQHYFDGIPKAENKLRVEAEDFLYAEIFLDPATLPKQVMLQWNDGSWEHRAYWGESKIRVGVESTSSLRYRGPLPAAGGWVRLEVPAPLVGLAGKELAGMAFTLFDGGALWGAAGKRTPSWNEELTHVPKFLTHTGISYLELVDLLRTQYVNQAIPTGKELAFFERIPVSYATLRKLVASDFADVDAQTTKALSDAEMSVGALSEWANLNFERIGKMIVSDAPDSSCDLNLTWLQHLSGDALGDDDLHKLHRFIRLWRKLGWTIPDMDRAIVALQANDITTGFLRQLSQVVQIQSILNLPPQKVLSFWSRIPITGDDALYQKLFLNKAVREIDAAFGAKDGEFLPDGENLKIDDHLPALLAALRTRASDLALIRRHTGLAEPDSPLTIGTVTTLYRFVTLARALELAVEDLISIDELSGRTAFESSAKTLAFIRLVERIRKSGFEPAVLNYLFRKLDEAPEELKLSKTAIQELLVTIREGLVRIAADNIPEEDPEGVFTRAKLGLLFEPHIVEQIAALIAGTQSYFTPLTNLPAGARSLIRVPPAEAQARKVTYDEKKRLLRATSWLTETDRTALQGLSNTDDYKAAVQSLFDQPRNLVKQTLEKLGWTTATKDLASSVFEVNSFDADGNLQPLVVANKFKVFLHEASPMFRAELSRAFVKQTLAESLHLETPIAALLLEGLDDTVPLGADATPAVPAIQDFLALVGDGLRGTYFNNKDFTPPAADTRVDPVVNFRWEKGRAISVRWQGSLLADKTQQYQFHIRAGGGVKFKIDGDSIDHMVDEPPAEYTLTKDLEANRLYSVELEYFNSPSVAEVSPEALIELRWSSAANPAEIVPSYRLYSNAPNKVFAAAEQTYVRLHKASLLVNGHKLPAPEVAQLTEPSQPAGLDLNQLPVEIERETPQALFSRWLRWNDFTDLRALTVHDASALIEVFKSSDTESALVALRRATGWDENILKSLAGITGFNFGLEELQNTENLLKLADGMRLLFRMGAPVGEVLGWANSSRTVSDAITNSDPSLSSATAAFTQQDEGRRVTGAGIAENTFIMSVTNATTVVLSEPTIAVASDVRITVHGDSKTARAAAQEAKRAHKAKYDNDSWLEIARAVADQLRELQRAALVDYLLPQLGFKTADELFEYFLIDVEMSPCMQTSRIKQAISSVQLFIQRCRMNLEGGLSPKLIDQDRWKWMQNYRVWEANLKVFLYPENWIEPELRDDKSPFFRELEAELMQGEVTTEAAEIALGTYLEKLAAVSQLRICGMFEQTDFGAGESFESILHVFGCTFSAPQTFYYRQFVTVNQSYRYWTPWENVPLDIAGDEVLPVVWNRRLHLFWPVVAEKATTDNKGKELWARIAWSEYRSGKWSGKRLTGASQATKINFPLAPKLELVSNGNELIIGFTRAVATGIQHFGNLAFQNSAGLVDTRNPGPALVPYKGFHPSSLGILEFVGKVTDPVIPVFARIPLGARVSLFPPDDTSYFLNDPFFFQEGPRSYLVRPRRSLTAEIERGLAVDATPRVVATKDKSAVTLSGSFAQLSTKANPWLSGRASIAAIESRSFSESAPKSAGVSLSSEIFKHGVVDAAALLVPRYPADFTFETFFHPYTLEFQRRLHSRGVPGLLNIGSQIVASLPTVASFKDVYDPDRSTVKTPWPVHDVDFSFEGAYSLYNWELFFHVPLYLAAKLSQNQRFEESMSWFHFIFDPTAYSPGDTTAKRYWNVLPLRETQPQRLDDMLKALNNGDKNVIAQWDDLQKHPFQPHRIARLRRIAYQKTVVMKYIDNLIAWGDQLFSRDTIESINQATQLYVLAAKLLGSRTQRVPPRGRMTAKTYAQLRSSLDELGQAMVQFENDLPFGSRATAGESSAETMGLMGIGRSTYFCLPKNDKLAGYWDTVADRLFKIRHCMNIEGVVRELPLFEPPIDPALLVRAAAQGIDLSSVLNDMSTPLPSYRFNTILGKALELTSELRALGAALLAALEKRDAEHLASLRAAHETELLSLVKEIKKQQLAEAKTAEEALEKSRDVTQVRFDFYNNIQQRIAEEMNQLDELATGQIKQSQGQQAERVASDIAMSTPDTTTGAQLGGSAAGPIFSMTIGRANIIAYYQAISREKSYQASIHSNHANLSSILGGWKRRSDDWKLQRDLAGKELIQIDKQITAAQIRVAIAQQELGNTTRQIEQSQEVHEFLRNKFTNEELYNWMAGGISTIFFQCYQMTYDLAKQAERCYRYELGQTSSNFIQFGAWDSQRKGLLAGERLYLQLKQLERAYLNGNRREYELTKHYSLVLNDPQALIQLRAQGKCEITLPEELFDSDYPGHYMRRIKNVSISIPAVVGPYAGVNCTLTLLKDKTRVKSTLGDGYAEREGEEDDRFATNWARMQAIATSGGQNDSGMFEINFRDERYLPFEGAGAISRWRIEMYPESNAFDFNTLADVVLHVRYSARDGGERLKQAAKVALSRAIGVEANQPQARLFSLKHEFPTEWYQFTHGDGPFTGTFMLTKDRFPFLFRGRKLTAGKVSLYAVLKSGAKLTAAEELAVNIKSPGPPEALIKFLKDRWPEILPPETTVDVAPEEIKVAPADAKWILTTDAPNSRLLADKVDDLLLVCEYSVG